MKELYLIIKTGYEGIDKIIYPSLDKNDAINKINEIRNTIFLSQKEKEKYNEDEWDGLFYSRKISGEEHSFGLYGEPEFYCIQRWNGIKFDCVCENLNVNITDKTMFR